MGQLPYDEATAQQLVNIGALDPSTLDMARQQQAFQNALVPQDDEEAVAGAPTASNMSDGPALGMPATPARPYDMNKMPLGMNPLGGLPEEIPASSSSATEAPSVSSPEEKPKVDLSNTTLGAPKDKAAPDFASGMSQDMKGVQAGYDQQEKANREGEAGIGKVIADHDKFVREESNNIAEKQKAMDASEAKRQEIFQGQIASFEKAQSEVEKAATIDPNRVWNNMGTGQKITAGIAIFLGGLGGGLSGQGGNAALDVIDKAINRDLEAQKLNVQNRQNTLSNKLNLVGLYRGMFQDQRTADLAALDTMWKQVQNKTAQMGIQIQGQEARTRYKSAMGEIQARRAEIQMSFRRSLWEMSAKAQVYGGKGMNDPMSLAMLPEADQKKLVKLPDGRIVPTLNEKSVETVNKFTPAYKDVTDILDRLDELKGASLPMTQKSELAKQSMAALKPLLNEMSGITRFTDEDNKVVLDPQVADPTAFLQGRSAAKLSNLRSIVNSKADSLYSTHIPGYRAIRRGAPK